MNNTQPKGELEEVSSFVGLLIVGFIGIAVLCLVAGILIGLVLP